MVAKIGHHAKLVGEGICVSGVALFILLVYLDVVLVGIVPKAIEQEATGAGIIMVMLLPLIGGIWVFCKLLGLIAK